MEDLRVDRNIQRNFGHFPKFEPWVKKMNPEDRLIINYTPEKALKIDGHLVIGSVWSGRLPRVTEEKEVEDKIKRK